PTRVWRLGIGGWSDEAKPWRAKGWLEPGGGRQGFPRGQETVLRFQRGRPAEGRVEMPKGWSSAEVAAYAGELQVSTAKMRQDGTFSIPLPVDVPGPFRLAVGIRRM